MYRMPTSPHSLIVDRLHPIENTCLITWQEGDFRFHIWADQDSLALSPDYPHIFKNPLVENPRRLDTRLLDPEVKANAATLEAVRKIIRDGSLIQAARDKVAAEEREMQRHQHLRAHAARVWRARMNQQPDPAWPADITEGEFWVYSAALARDMFGEV